MFELATTILSRPLMKRTVPPKELAELLRFVPKLLLARKSEFALACVTMEPDAPSMMDAAFALPLTKVAALMVPLIRMSEETLFSVTARPVIVPVLRVVFSDSVMSRAAGMMNCP